MRLRGIEVDRITLLEQLFLPRNFQPQRAAQDVNEFGAVMFVRARARRRMELHPVRVQLPLGRRKIKALEFPRRVASTELLGEPRALFAADDAECAAGGGRGEEVI